MRTAALIVPFVAFCIAGVPLPAQSVDREALAARLKARIDERLAEMVVQLRAELHREIDAALAEEPQSSGRLDRLIDDLRGRPAGVPSGVASPSARRPRSVPAPPARPTDPGSRGTATEPDPTPGEVDAAARARLDALTKRVTELEASGAPAETVAALRARLEAVRAAIENRTESPPVPTTAQSAGETDSRPSPPSGDAVFKQAWERAVRKVVDAGGAIQPSTAGRESAPDAPETRPSQKNSQSQTTGGVGKLGSESRSH